MASSAEIRERIDSLLDGVSADVASLPSLGETWDSIPEKERFVWDIEWSEQMRRLESLDQYYRAGDMNPGQNSCYRELLQKLKAELPILRRLDLELPSVSLDGEKAA